jgi:hypothetical protein
MQENKKNDGRNERNEGNDFLFQLYFGKEKIKNENGCWNFFEKKLLNQNFPSQNSPAQKTRRGRGPDRSKRKPQPWAVGEATHRRILDLLREGRGRLWIARQLGVGVRTVQRRVDILRREEDDEETIDFREVRGKVCPRHGALTVWPCVQCAAEEARRS